MIQILLSLRQNQVMTICNNCQQSFAVRDTDREFYEKMKVPEPMKCPDCRQQRRWAFRNHRKLYKRKCDFTGEDTLSLYSPDKPYKAYKEKIWWGDQWDPLEYGRDFDFDRPFFEQLNELMLDVPRRAMHQDGSNENCDYITFGMSNKNGYLLFSCFYTEDSYYSSICGFGKDYVDCLKCSKSELVYECVDCDKCYNSAYLLDCTACSDSYLLEACRNCTNCIACKNLRNKEYHVYNKPVSKEEFEAFKAKMLEEGVEKELARFNEWKLELPTLYAHKMNCDNCDGDYIYNSRNCYGSFDVIMGAENCNYCQFCGWKGHNLWDCTFCGKESSFLYEFISSVTSNESAFSQFCRGCSKIYYCDCMDSCHDCFGCVGLRHKEYCILNKQYSKEEYEELLPRIIEHMKKTGEWGEGFPIEFSPFAYNETMAQDHFPLSKEEAVAKGYKWKDEEERVQASGEGVVNCDKCTRSFRYIPQELRFYEKMGLKAPKACQECRYEARLKLRNPYKMWQRNCDKCGVDFMTSYSPDRPEKLYCEKCYLGEVY